MPISPNNSSVKSKRIRPDAFVSELNCQGRVLQLSAIYHCHRHHSNTNQRLEYREDHHLHVHKRLGWAIKIIIFRFLNDHITWIQDGHDYLSLQGREKKGKKEDLTRAGHPRWVPVQHEYITKIPTIYKKKNLKFFIIAKQLLSFHKINSQFQCRKKINFRSVLIRVSTFSLQVVHNFHYARTWRKHQINTPLMSKHNYLYYCLS